MKFLNIYKQRHSLHISISSNICLLVTYYFLTDNSVSGYDCPPLDGIYNYCCAIAGGTLTAAKALCNGIVDIAIHWCGGWNHAQRYLCHLPI